MAFDRKDTHAELGDLFSRLAQQFIPDSFVLGIGLTLVVCVFALPRLDYDVVRLADGWQWKRHGAWRSELLHADVLDSRDRVRSCGNADGTSAHQLVAQNDSATTLVSLIAMGQRY